MTGHQCTRYRRAGLTVIKRREKISGISGFILWFEELGLPYLSIDCIVFKIKEPAFTSACLHMQERVHMLTHVCNKKNQINDKSLLSND